MAKGLSPKLPLTVDAADGAYLLNHDYVEMVKQNFKMLLLTDPGERIMDLNFGVGLRRMLFENKTNATYGDITAKIKQQVSTYLPFLDIQLVEFADGEEASVISIKISYDIIPLNYSDLLIIDEKIPE
jgi:phage baseplate assembly protein W